MRQLNQIFNIWIIVMLVLIPNHDLIGQATPDSLNIRDRESIKRQAKFVVEEFQKLLINLSNKNNSVSDIEKIIYNNIEGDKIFWNADITVEDDLNPKFTDYQQPLDKRVEDYLKDFDIYYTKGANSTIEFDSLRVSNVEKSKDGYWFVKIVYSSRFLNRHKDFLVPYPTRKRLAEVRAEKRDVGFEVYILSVRYFDPMDSTEYGEFDFLPEVIEEKFSNLQEEANFWLSRGKYEQALDLLRDAYALKSNSLVEQTIRGLEDKISAIETRRQYFDIEGYNEFIQKYEDPDAYVGRGLLYMQNKDYAAAISDFDKAVELNPQLLEAYTLRGEAMIGLGNYFSAAESYEEALVLDPSNLELTYTVAKMWHLQGNYLNEIEVLSKSINQFPEESKLYELRSRARFGLRNYRSTAEDIQVLTYLSGDSALFWYQLGNIYLLQQDTMASDSVMAIADSINSRVDRQALRLTASYFARAKLAFEDGRYNQAIDTLNELILLQPDHLDAYLLRGKACLESGFTTFAVYDLTEVLSKEENAEAYLYRGRAALALKNANEAKSDLEAAINTDRYLCDAYMILGEILVEEDNYKEAVTRYNQGLLCEPNQPEKHYQLAQLHFKHEAYEDAEKSAGRAINLKQDLADAHLLLGRSQVKQNNFREAIQHYENFIKYDEFNPKAFMQLAEFYETYYGMDKRAKKYREKAEELKATSVPVDDEDKLQKK